LLVEKEQWGSIDIKAFYMRRVLRIWPLFYFCVFFGFVVFPQMKLLFGQVPNEPARWPFYAAFLNNFDFIRHFPDSSELSILWSVAIEEQFYLVWPVLLSLVSARYYGHLFVAIILGSFLFRFFYAHHPVVLEHHTLSCISDMTVGGLAAIAVYYLPRFKVRIQNMKRWVIVLLYLSVLTVFLFRQQIFQGNALLLAADRLVISGLFALVILEQNYAERSLFKMSRHRLSSRLGTYTYGLYCLHMIGILIVALLLRKLGLNRNVYEVIFLEGGGSLLLTIGLAWLSYRYYESWFLRLKGRFARVGRA
jgi:peptidoglycan/LPS O-acetylase OafA/YrhL